MPTYIIFSYINHDGIGDFTHYENIMDKLTHYDDVRLVSIILFSPLGKPENKSRIQAKLCDKPNVYFGTEDEHLSTFLGNPHLLHDLQHADQAFCISYGGIMPEYKDHLKQAIPVKYIAEHDGSLAPRDAEGAPASEYHLERSLGLPAVAGHYGDFPQGIKLLDAPPVSSFQAQWALITENDPAFSARVLACTDSADATALSKHHHLMAAYFNRCWDFFEFLRIFTVSLPDPEMESLVMHYSGTDLFDFIREKNHANGAFSYLEPDKTPYLERLFREGHIKELLILSPDPQKTLRIQGNDSGTLSIKVLTGFYLSDTSLQRMYQLSTLAAVSGDNTLELAISMGVLPFYCSTNWNTKKRTLIALREITQLPELALSEAAKQSFNIFFNPASIETSNFFDSTFPRHDRSVNLSDYARLDFPAMIEAWPKIAEYIRLNYNFYDRLDDIVREGLPTHAQPKRAEAPLVPAPPSPLRIHNTFPMSRALHLEESITTSTHCPMM